MAHSRHHLRRPRTAVLDRLSDNPLLPAYVEQLPPPQLHKLVQHIGKEDAQLLLRYATDPQIQEMIESDTFVSAVPGAVEEFEPDRFLEWLELWSEMGTDFLTAKLIALGTELFALTLQHYVVVVDLDEVGVSDHVDTFHQFGVMPRDDEHWPLLLRLLTEIWSEDNAFLEESLARCCQRRSLLVEKTHITDNEALPHDVAENRDRHRREKGYITSTGAAAFLNAARSASLQALLVDVAYDPFTAMHLARLQGTTTAATDKSSQSEPAVSARADAPAQKSASHHWTELDTAFLQLGLNATGSLTHRLEAPAGVAESYLKRQLRLLGETHPALVQARQQEIVFLANILMEGSPVQGERFTGQQAADCVYATCNLGLMYCVFEDTWDDEAEVLESLLAREPGLIKCFRIGFHLLADLPRQVFMAIEQTLAATAVERRLAAHPWLQQHTTDAFAAFRLRSRKANQTRALSALLDALALVADATTCQQLRILGDALPGFPLSLEAQAGTSIHVDKRRRYIDKPADLDLISGYLRTLQAKLL